MIRWLEQTRSDVPRHFELLVIENVDPLLL